MIITSSTARRPFLTSFVSLSCASLILLVGPSTRAQNRAELRAPSSFSSIPDTPTRSRALFSEAAKVIMNPRCMNCHTGEAFPRQGDDAHRHQMNVSRGPADAGVAALHCSVCHQSKNQSASGAPGAAAWRLAPVRMKWSGLTVGELCRSLLDPTRGGMKPEQFVAHFNTSLVRWAWTPGGDAHGQARTRPPMSHEEFIALTERWVATGAACPP